VAGLTETSTFVDVGASLQKLRISRETKLSEPHLRPLPPSARRAGNRTMA
jgi:hypothetical protein